MLIESSLMKQKIMKKTSLLIGAFTICMSLGLFAACNHPQQKTEETKLVSLKTFPTTDAHLSVNVSEDRSQAVISRDGQVIQTITDEARTYYGMPEGAYVYNVFEGSGAYEAGIRKGDVITKLEGTTIYSNSSAREILQYYRQGEEVTVKYSRMENGEYVSHEVTVVLGGSQTTK